MLTANVSLATSQTCKENSISKFKLDPEEFDQFRGKWRGTEPGEFDGALGKRGGKLLDFCSLPEGLDIPPPVKQTMEWMGKVHHRVADYSGLSARQLFEQGLEIKIVPSHSGEMGSEFRTPALWIGEFSDWDGRVSNIWLYAHELGHWYVSEAAKRHHLFLSPFDTPVTSEGIADFFATIWVGNSHLFSGLPNEFSQAIRMGPNQPNLSFLDDPYLFSTKQDVVKQSELCSHLDQAHPFFNHAKEHCEKLSRLFGDLKDVRYPTFEPSNCYDKKDGKFGSWDRNACDSHRLGIPTSQFLLALSKETQTPNLVWKALQTFKSQTSQFSCRIAISTQPKDAVVVQTEVNQLSRFFQELRSHLSVSDQTSFDRLYSYYGIERAVELDQFYTHVTQAPELAFPLLKERLESDKKFWKRNKECNYSFCAAKTGQFSNCWVVCDQVKSEPEQKSFWQFGKWDSRT